MSETVTLSSQLIGEAQAAATAGQRSPESQIEYWARLGRSVDAFLTGQLGSEIGMSDRPLADLLQAVSAPEGRDNLQVYLQSRPFPHYEPAGDDTQDLIRTEGDGTRTRGRFEGRIFRPTKTSSSQ